MLHNSASSKKLHLFHHYLASEFTKGGRADVVLCCGRTIDEVHRKAICCCVHFEWHIFSARRLKLEKCLLFHNLISPFLFNYGALFIFPLPKAARLLFRTKKESKRFIFLWRFSREERKIPHFGLKPDIFQSNRKSISIFRTKNIHGMIKNVLGGNPIQGLDKFNFVVKRAFHEPI